MVWSFVPDAACDLDWMFVVATALFLSVFNPDCASLFCLEDLSLSRVGLVCSSIEILLLLLFWLLRLFVTSEVVASFLVNVCCWDCVAVLRASPWLSSLSFGCDCACWLSTFGLSDVFDSVDCCCSVDLIMFGLVSFEEVFASSDLTTFECGWSNASFLLSDVSSVCDCVCAVVFLVVSSSLEAVSVDCVDGSSCLDDSDCCVVMPSLVVGLEVCVSVESDCLEVCLASVCWLSLFEVGFSDFTVVLWCVSSEVEVVSFVVGASSVCLLIIVLDYLCLNY